MDAQSGSKRAAVASYTSRYTFVKQCMRDSRLSDLFFGPAAHLHNGPQWPSPVRNVTFRTS